MTITRALLAKSWSAMKRRNEELGVSPSNEASAAGRYLERASNDARQALAMLPTDTDGTEEGEAYWATVADYLQRVIDEENEANFRTGT